MIDLLMIQVIVCFIIDCSGVIQSLEKGLSKRLGYKVAIPKPFSCSLCSGWWLNLIYLLCTGRFTLPLILAAALISYFSKTISGILIWIQELFVWVLDRMYRWLR